MATWDKLWVLMLLPIRLMRFLAKLEFSKNLTYESCDIKDETYDCPHKGIKVVTIASTSIIKNLKSELSVVSTTPHSSDLST